MSFQQPPRATVHPNAGLPRAVVYRDSFANNLVAMLSEHFSHALYLWTYDFHPQVIERERPDVVILEMGERALRRPFPGETGVPIDTGTPQ